MTKMDRKKFLNLRKSCALLRITSLAACDKNRYSKTEELLEKSATGNAFALTSPKIKTVRVGLLEQEIEGIR